MGSVGSRVGRAFWARAAGTEVVRLMEAKWARGASEWGAPKTYETLRIGDMRIRRYSNFQTTGLPIVYKDMRIYGWMVL